MKKKSKYIARCDGDDYWIDSKKLQKQVDALEENYKSKWCSTDCDVITSEGELVHKSAFETGYIKRAESYLDMLVTKGFTMSSTWLVDTDLMQKINLSLDQDTADDTFNIQLDLFSMTKLTYLPESTVVYRVNEGSDSSPIDVDVLHRRYERLLKTQLEYLEKYKEPSLDDIVNELFKHSKDIELVAEERLRMIHNLLDQIKSYKQNIKDRDLQIAEIVESRSYRVGRFIISSLSMIKSIPARLKQLKP